MVGLRASGGSGAVRPSTRWQGPRLGAGWAPLTLADGEGGDLGQARPVARRRVDLKRRDGEAEPVERGELPRVGGDVRAGIRVFASTARRRRARPAATSGSVTHCTTRTRASVRNGVSRGRQTWSWKAASATVVTPDRSSSSSTPKNTGSVRMVSSSPGAAVNPGTLKP